MAASFRPRATPVLALSLRFARASARLQVNSWCRYQCWTPSSTLAYLHSTASIDVASTIDIAAIIVVVTLFRHGVQAKASGPPVRDRMGFRIKPVRVLSVRHLG